jgi:hypothetical protein
MSGVVIGHATATAISTIMINSQLQLLGEFGLVKEEL